MNLLYKMSAAAIIAAALVVLTTPLVKRLAVRLGAVRAPRDRDVHQNVMPLWGGLAIWMAFAVVVLLLRPLDGQAFAVAEKGSHPILGILLGGGILVFFGLLDDKYDLKPWQQILALLTGSLIAALLGARIDGLTNPFAPAVHGLGAGGKYDPHSFLPLGIWSVPVSVLWISAVTKLFDFLDGLDGLAAGICAIAATTIGLISAVRSPHETAVALLAATLAGACIGFLRHNYNPASIFMGSVGSFFLGFALACLSVIGTAKLPTLISVAVPLLVLGVPVVDGLYVITRRIVTGQKPMAADKTHIHHRLRDRGWSTQKTVWAIYGLTASGCIVALILAWHWAR